jgi:hypothetical protein
MLLAALPAVLPILVELFTSEGCSSCPPADAVLARLHEAQPVPGVQLLVLSEHVDYWDDLGWKDPYSDRLFTERQSRYGSRTYTPQAMVDGRTDVLGSDGEGIVRAAKAAAAQPHGSLAVKPGKNANVQISVTALPAHAAAQVWLAIVEDGLVDKVLKGENAGRTMAHTAVVRTLVVAGEVAAGERQWSGEAKVPADAGWKHPRVVVFVQEREAPRVLAAGALQLL